jgi:hypothetical protein
VGLVASLFILAGLAWWWTVDQMKGMDGGPWTELGTLGWFLGVWVMMMTAMMFPSVAPTVALYSRIEKSGNLGAPSLFTAGYLASWAGVGVLAFVVATVGGRMTGDVLAWDRAGRWVAGASCVGAQDPDGCTAQGIPSGPTRAPARGGTWVGVPYPAPAPAVAPGQSAPGFVTFQRWRTTQGLGRARGSNL